jgi:hypothetical protein
MFNGNCWSCIDRLPNSGFTWENGWETEKAHYSNMPLKDAFRIGEGVLAISGGIEFTMLAEKQISKYIIRKGATDFEKRRARELLLKSWGVRGDFVDVNKSVYTQTLDAETSFLYQYRIPGSEKGSYYVNSLDITPGQVGLDASDFSETYKVTLNTDFKVLNSTHKVDSEYYLNPGQLTPGGGKQIFSKDLKNNAKFELIE